MAKYKNKQTIRVLNKETIVFDSIKEAARYQELKFQQYCGVISDLELQPRYILQEKFVYKSKSYGKISYYADFRYKKDSEVWVEDVKGFKTAVTNSKRRC